MPEAKTKTFCWLFPLSPPVPPAHPASHPGPRLEALPNLSYCFKPKFTVSVGGQDPLSPPSLHPTLRTLGLSRGWRPCSPPLCSCPARGEGKQAEGRRWAALGTPRGSRPLGRWAREPSSQPWAAYWGLSRPLSPGPSPPSHWECGFQRRSWKKSETLHRPPMGDPNLRPRTGCI